jgi:hypothetical protein
MIADLESEPASRSDRPLGARERESLLRLIVGMAIKGYAYNPKAAKNTATKEIADDLRLLGLALDEDTIRKYLSEAKDHLPGDETEQNR